MRAVRRLRLKLEATVQLLDGHLYIDDWYGCIEVTLPYTALVPWPAAHRILENYKFRPKTSAMLDMIKALETEIALRKELRAG